MNQTTRQRITGSLVLAVTALVLLPVIFDGEGSYQPSVQPDIPARPTQPQAALQDPARPAIMADSDAIRIRPESPATVIVGGDNRSETVISDASDSTAAPATTSSGTGTTSSTATGATPTPASSSSAPASTATAATPADNTSPVTTSSTTSPETASPTATSSLPAAQTPSPVATSPSTTAQTARLDVQGLPEGWSVRLGSFSSADNASNLVTRLQAAGHRAYTRRVESSQGVLTAVFVGPQVDRTAAQNLMERLRQDFQLNGMIVRYEIETL